MMLIGIFQEELRLQCTVLLKAAHDLTQANERLNDKPTSTNPTERFAQLRRMAEVDDVVWIALQQILVAAANISKLLWGGPKQDVERSDLRATVGILDSSPLKDRDMRGDWEHIDRKLEDWFKGTTRHVYLGRLIGGAAPEGFKHTRHYDPLTGDVSFWSHSVNIPAVVAEARAMHSRLETLR